MYKNEYSKFKNLAKHINGLIGRGKWASLSEEQQNKLQKALLRLTERVKTFIGKRQLVRVLGAALMLISVNAKAQSFAAPISDPFGIENVDSYLYKPVFVDIDGDGDFDHFISKPDGGGFYFQENIGTAELPEFSASVNNPFGLEPAVPSLLPIFGDIDGDGDFDLFSNTYDEGIALFYENVGTPTDPAFAAEVSMPFGLIDVYTILDAFVDIDGDGDLDLFASKYDELTGEARLFFIENIGDADVPNFDTPEVDPFGLTVSETDYFTFIDFADLDDDGDQDIMRVTMYGSTVFYHENIGTAGSPAFAGGSGIESPFGITPLPLDSYFVAPTLIDIDNDGDFDLFASEYYGTTLFYENTSINVGVPEFSIADGAFTVYPNPASETLWIKSNTNSTSTIQSVTIRAVDGRIMLQSSSINQGIEISTLPAGVYLMEIALSTGESTLQKFTKI